MKIVLATNNKDKIREILAYFRDLDLDIIPLTPSPLGGEGGVRGEFKLKEEGTTLRDNALQKARTVAKATGQWALADDTGLFVEALEGRPGVFSSRYAGEGATYEQNVSKLLEEMRDVSDEKRDAYFSCVMALVYPDGREVTVEGRLEGTIAREPCGDHGFGYDPIFFLPDRACTLAEIPLEEKNKISHRGRALWKMRGVVEILNGGGSPAFGGTSEGGKLW